MPTIENIMLNSATELVAMADRILQEVFNMAVQKRPNLQGLYALLQVARK